jgi:hypothetical protein
MIKLMEIAFVPINQFGYSTGGVGQIQDNNKERLLLMM